MKTCGRCGEEKSRSEFYDHFSVGRSLRDRVHRSRRREAQQSTGRAGGCSCQLDQTAKANLPFEITICPAPID